MNAEQEIRSSKSEILNKFKAQMSKCSKPGSVGLLKKRKGPFAEPEGLGHLTHRYFFTSPIVGGVLCFEHLVICLPTWPTPVGQAGICFGFRD